MAALHQRLIGLDSDDAAAEEPRPPPAPERIPRPGDVVAAAIFGSWDAAPDLERWLTSFYQFYELKGYKGVVATQLLHVFAVAFTIAFSFWLIFVVNWEAVMSCHSDEVCREMSLVYSNPLRHMTLCKWVMLLCFFLLCVYWVTTLVNTLCTLRDATDMSQYYKERLGIVSDDALSTMSWSEVVSRLVKQQRTTPFCIVQDELSALEIANIIMREDNFIIALTNHRALTNCLPRRIPARLAYTRSVLTVVRLAVFRWAFDSRGRLRDDFLQHPENLAQRLRRMGYLALLLVVPVSVFVTMVLFMRRAEEFRSHRTAPLRREWTDYAKWTFREFNEFPHQFKERMRSAQTVAEEFESCSRPSTPVRDSIQRFVKFIAGSVLAALLLLALWDDTPLLFVTIREKNLLWYLALFGFLFAVADNSGEDAAAAGRSVPQAPAPSCTGAPLLMHVAMMRLVRFTHYYPVAWRAPAPLAVLAGGCSGLQRWRLRQHFEAIRSQFLTDFFVHRIRALIEELLGVLLTPFLLMIWLPRAAPDIIDVMRRCRYPSENLGDWCVFGCLDPAKRGHYEYSGPLCTHHSGDGNSSSAWEPHGLGCMAMEPQLLCHGGKLEKSVLSFILSHRLQWASRVDSDSDFAFGHDPMRGGTPGSSDGRAHGARTFRRDGAGVAADRSGVAIPMRQLADRSQDADGEASPPPLPPQFQGMDPVNDTSRVEIWGYPASALSLLHNLEEFQQHETRGTSLQQRSLYKLFPEELLRLERAAPVPGGAAIPPPPPSMSTEGRIDSQAAQGTCSSHFFWLEVFCDFNSGSHTSHCGDAGGGARFELLDGGGFGGDAGGSPRGASPRGASPHGASPRGVSPRGASP